MSEFMKQSRSNRSGSFITFEGGEGAGKSSQIGRLQSYLEKQGHEVLVTREPGGSPGAEAVRHVLLSGAAEPLGPEIETILFFAARSDNVEMMIKPALAAGKVVLCDRYIDSTRVYQGKSGNVSGEMIESLIRVACEDAIPDLTLILDISPQEGMKRANVRRKQGDNPGQPDRFEKDDFALQEQRRQGFLDIAKKEPERCVVIDANRHEEQVFDDILAAIGRKMPKFWEQAGLAKKGKAKSDKKGKTHKQGKAKV